MVIQRWAEKLILMTTAVLRAGNALDDTDSDGLTQSQTAMFLAVIGNVLLPSGTCTKPVFYRVRNVLSRTPLQQAFYVDKLDE